MADTSVIAACGHCGQKNRIPRARIGDNPSCGKCKKPVFPAEPINATERSFKDQVEQSPIPVLVDFWAPWCGPCRMMAGPLAQIARERATKLKVVKVNVDENPGLAARFGVRSIPQLSFFSQGRQVDQLLGAASKHELDRRLAKLL